MKQQNCYDDSCPLCGGRDWKCFLIGKRTKVVDTDFDVLYGATPLIEMQPNMLHSVRQDENVVSFDMCVQCETVFS